MVRSTRFSQMRRDAKLAGMAGLSITLMTATARPAYAGDGAAVTVGVIGGTVLGLFALGASWAYGPPPPYGVGPMDVGPDDGGARPLCRDMMVESFDPYTESYVETPRRVCDGY